MYSIGCTDAAMVRTIQTGLSLPPTGIYDAYLEARVKYYQNTNNLVVTGVVDKNTLHSMGILDTDLKSQLHFVTPDQLVIQKHYLPEGEFIRDSVPILNDYLILHHTAGWDNPFATVDCWAKDNRGTIGTEFVIGGQRVTNAIEEFDGVVVQAFPTGCAGWHVASTSSGYLNRHAVGIECCNFGYLTDQNKTYVGNLATVSQIATLAEAFKGFTKWHRYSDKQLYSLRRLILFVAERDNIDVHIGLYQWIHKDGVTKAFDFKQDAADGKIKGMLVHANTTKGKFDMFPQQELVDMILTL